MPADGNSGDVELRHIDVEAVVARPVDERLLRDGGKLGPEDVELLAEEPEGQSELADAGLAHVLDDTGELRSGILAQARCILVELGRVGDGVIELVPGKEVERVVAILPEVEPLLRRLPEPGVLGKIGVAHVLVHHCL